MLDFLLGSYHHDINYDALLQTNLFNNRPCSLYYLIIAFRVLLSINCVSHHYICCPHSDENEDIHDTHGAIVPFSESKLAIEQMVMKETFSRYCIAIVLLCGLTCIMSFFSGQPTTIKCGTKIILSIDISFIKSVDGASLDSLRSSSCNPCCVYCAMDYNGQTLKFILILQLIM